ncbi:MAG TPA: hypothetical protein VFZ65_03460 [Planctomycetota bacterium]|nr:hypothetical protein [Planctomycetota bacterium]
MTTATSVPAADTWTTQLEQLRARYKHVREPILVALNILLHDPNIALDDAKAQAAVHGVKITAASVSGAQRLLSRMDGEPATTAPTVPTTVADQKTGRSRPARRTRPAEGAVDAEALIRQVVGKLQNQGNAEAERLRETMRKAIRMLQAAIE